ncbi:MAG: heavy-metal-associated domain-containing protein [Urechidicola sp.]|nr:heavy-metal-associated domain-containing protein [Urechidicola sp.]
MQTIQVENLKCGGCASTIKKGLISIDGIETVTIEVETSEVSINADDTAIVASAIKKLSTMGYPQVGDPNSILKKAKSYVSCAVGKMNQED